MNYCNRCEQNTDRTHWCTPKEVLDAITKK